jgi:uncharacterized membrane protein YeaQ/YmgE (transglycosylase-associated protein family)
MSIKTVVPIAYLGINGLLYLILAALFVFEPIEWFVKLGIQLQDPLGYTELKTMYVGLMGSMAAFFLLGAWQKSMRLSSVLFAAISYTMLAAVRSYGIFIDELFDDFTFSLLYAETVSLLLGWLCVYLLLSQNKSAVNGQ